MKKYLKTLVLMILILCFASAHMEVLGEDEVLIETVEVADKSSEAAELRDDAVIEENDAREEAASQQNSEMDLLIIDDVEEYPYAAESDTEAVTEAGQIFDDTEEAVTEVQENSMTETGSVTEIQEPEEAVQITLEDISEVSEMDLPEETELFSDEMEMETETISPGIYGSIDGDEIIAVTTGEETWVNPEYESVIDISDLTQLAGDITAVSDEGQYYTEIADAAAYVREEWKKRADSITFNFKIPLDDYYSDLGRDIIETAAAHTGVSIEGDYLDRQCGGWNMALVSKQSRRYYYLTYTCTINYYTDAAQEAEMDSRIAQVMSSLELDGKSDYEKIEIIYNYITQNVTYDYEHLEDKSYLLKYTAYAALMNGTAVCQGYAVLFYRMALEAGLKVRYVGGETDVGGRHAWNIVKLGGFYYNLDTTWDAGKTTYSWFLKSQESFTNHNRDQKYADGNYKALYPMGKSDYISDESVESIQNGTCGTSVTWSLDNNGVLRLTGTGEMADYSDETLAPWNGLEIQKVILSEGISSIGSHAFCYFTDLTEVTLPNSLKKIGSYAFAGSSITAVTIPSGVTEIGENAFSGCTGLSTLTVPGSVTSIGANAFLQCIGLKSLTLSNGVTGIGTRAFARCTNLESLSIPLSAADTDSSVFGNCLKLSTITITGTGAIPDYTSDNAAPWNRVTVDSITIQSGITGIGAYAFYNMNVLQTVSIPSGVTTIGANAFANCQELSGITFPDSVTAIGENAFYKDTKLSSVTIPGSVKSIGKRAFYGAGLNSVVLQDKVSGIGEYAFYGCSSLTQLTIPISAAEAVGNTFGGCENLKQVDITGSGAMPDYKQASDVPWRQSSVQTVVIHSGVTSIGNYAFYNLDNLTSVTIPTSVKSIGMEAFYSCGTLSSVTIPGSVKSIGTNAFAFCEQLSAANITEGVQEIGEKAFYVCKKLFSVTIPGSVKSIGANAFAFCEQLSAVNITEGVQEIGESAFYKCVKLTSVTLSSSVQKVGSHAFAYCTGMQSISIKDGVTGISEYAFSGCSSLTQLTIPLSAAGAPGNAFNGCEKLTRVDITGSGSMPNYQQAADVPWRHQSVQTVVLHSKVTSIGNYAFYNMDQLTSVTIPASVKSIGTESFAFCDKLSAVKIPKGVTKVGEKAFYNCKKLSSVTISSTVKKIGTESFAFCVKLKSITLLNTVTSIGENAFAGCTKLSISGYPRTAASTYAEKHNITFKNKGCKAPTMKSAKSVSSGIKISWSKVSGAKGYQIYRKTDGKWQKLAEIKKGSTLTYTDKTVKKGTVYSYKIRVCNSGTLVSDYSAKSVSCVCLSTPKLSKVTNTKGKKIKVTWKKSTGASGYEIQYKTGTVKKVVKVTKESTVSKVLTGLQKNKTYKIWIRSYKTSGKNTWYSAWSTAKTVKVSK